MSMGTVVSEKYLLDIFNKLVSKDLYQKRQAKKIHENG